MTYRSNVKKARKSTFLISIGALSLIVFIVANFLSIWNQIYDMNKEKNILTKELKEMKEEEEYLKVEVEKLQDPDYVARYAREKYLFSKEGEFNIRIE